MRQCEVCVKSETDGKIIKHKHKTLLCWRHYLQTRRHGKVLHRTKYDKNEIRVVDDICYMDVYNDKGDVIATTTFNKIHLDRISKHKWNLHSAGYIDTAKENVFLHEFVIGKKKGFEIDHIDHDHKNNTDSNLRHVTHQQNVWNTVRKGYYWDDERKKWVVRLVCKGKKVLFKRCNTESEAIKLRRECEKKYFGKYSPHISF